jgi:Phosphatidylinositol-specific phospholipase C, X domain
MSSNPTDYLSQIKSLDEKFQTFMIIAFTLIILIIFIGYMIYLSKLEGKECDYMNTLYSSVDGNLRPITNSDPDCDFNLFDYYIKTAYNACSGGSYKNNFVDICNLKAVIKQGVRCLDFEIYSVGDQPVVATSTSDSYYVKETFNSVNFGSVMDTIRNYAFSGGTCPNPTDPLIIHLRCKSNNQKMYNNLANIFKSNTDIMLGPSYSYEAEGKNLGNVKLMSLKNKVILIIDRSNTAFLENQELLEYVNLTSNSIFMREYTYYDVKNNPDINELTEYNKRSMTIVIPNSGSSPENPSGLACRASGCQMVAMRYQLVDNFLMENAEFFDRAGYAFVLKPLELRYQPVTVAPPTPQIPQYSYATRQVATDYYSFKF